MLRVERWLNQKTCVVAEGETQLDVFKNLASAQEVFGEEKCGKCGSENLRFQVRNVVDGKKNYDYPELVCRDCWAKLSYGQSDDGLFPVRYERKDKEYVRDANGNKVKKGDMGWVKFDKVTGVEA